MSGRLKYYKSQLILLVVLLLICIPVSFVTFLLVAMPYAGDRLRENALMIISQSFPFLALILILLCGVGALVQYLFLSRHFMMPLRRLQVAAAEIRDGRLDHVLSCGGNDAFADVNRSFEEMRVRLKDSIWQAELSNRERSAMLAGICHDLKTPITSILGYSEGLLEGVAIEPQQVRDYLLVIRRKAESLRVLADDLSLLSHLENAQMAMEPVVVNFGLYVRSIFWEFASEHADFKLIEDVAEDAYCRLDRAQFARVLTNILHNSVKYKNPADKAPTVHLRLTVAEGQALLTITDNGIGVSSDSLPYVYERFYRGDSSRGKAAGSGLGLAIAWQIVNLHKGKTWLRSKEGEGTTVSILLPLAMDKGEEIAT